ncbi:MAG: hypothetical protein EPN88_06825 [Bacteroidetes bacterium]|nr:MAG: hypothetical protein EPN88_06825 [Bacteroidota bacterium]
MKHLIHFFYVVLLSCLVVTIIGCHKKLEDLGNKINSKQIELSDTSNLRVINVQQNGIDIEYCLLNENGQPATAFNEGEQFNFHLAITNNYDQDTSLYIVSDFLENPCLFMVFKNTSDTIGKPVSWNGMYKTGDYYNKLKKGQKWYMDIPWRESRGTEIPFNFNNLIRVFQHFFIGLNKPFLSKGTYFTEFKQEFCLGRYLPDPQYLICTDTLQLRINFEVK